ncbi:uncharacterized protein EI97DRAFT_24184 [Westerdykella ornata]|uniref:CENP-V/GFA domain-containing protein n=1 Tax=Westerdykella ornata TaxID=318751 RepID=A0A6A6JX92_WESOR|nr:uncharacterized protein EI97DRAFT_24184 [Westerdykella ornata]KAF2281241.1 hypothetical protein EI97DRAFT_24184 [Westerdykella ornata]
MATKPTLAESSTTPHLPTALSQQLALPLSYHHAPPGPTTYTCSCHCSRIRFTITLPLSLTDPNCEVVECNCSICTRNAYLLVYVPGRDLLFLNGEGERGLRHYQIHPNDPNTHLFCPVCGTACLTTPSNQPASISLPGQSIWGVNVRTVERLNLRRLRIKMIDGTCDEYISAMGDYLAST